MLTTTTTTTTASAELEDNNNNDNNNVVDDENDNDDDINMERNSRSNSDNKNSLRKTVPPPPPRPYSAENATIEELLIPILYYYDAGTTTTTTAIATNSTTTSTSATNTSHNKSSSSRYENYNHLSFESLEQQQNRYHQIQFAGLCQALYHLPNTLHSIITSNDSSHDNDYDNSDENPNIDHQQQQQQPQQPQQPRTNKIVQYDSNTALVFVPLMETTTTPTSTSTSSSSSRTVDIIAVAQILTESCSTNVPPPNIASDTTGSTRITTTPNAINNALQRTYLQFCLLRHGTIHERLLQTSSSLLSSSHPPPQQQPNTNHSNQPNIKKKNDIHYDDCYPGMEQLYRYYQQREKQQQQQQQPSTDSTNDINHLTTSDPSKQIAPSYTKLCHDLQHHYDDFIRGLTSNYGYQHTTEYIDRYHIPLYPSITTPNNHEQLQQQQLPESIHHHLMTSMKTAPSIESPAYVIGVSIFRNNELLTYDTQPLNRNTASLMHIVRTESSDGGNITTITWLSKEVAVLLFQYMKQIQLRMIQQLQPSPLLPSSSLDSNNSKQMSTNNQPMKKKSSSLAKLLRPFALSFLKDDCIVSSPIQCTIGSPSRQFISSATTTTSTTHETRKDTNNSVTNKGVFLSPPPFSLLSVLDDDQATSFIYQDSTEMEENGNQITTYVWAPCVALPITTTFYVTDEESEMEQVSNQRRTQKTEHARMCLYMRNDIHCLVYLSRPDYEDKDDSHSSTETNDHSRIYQRLFHDISQQMDVAMDEMFTSHRNDHHHQEPHPNDTAELILNCSSSTTTTSWEIPSDNIIHIPHQLFIPPSGLDLLIIDRWKHTISIHVDETSSTTFPFDNTSGTTTANQQHKRKNDNNAQRHFNGGISSFSSNDDVRHLFQQQQYWTMDVVLALEDAIDEVQQYMSTHHFTLSIFRHTDSTTTQPPPQRPSSYEACTLLPHHWVYSYCANHGLVELYVLFHTTHYSTISEVQDAAQRIRNVYLLETV